MSGSNRLHDLAVRGWLIAALCCLALPSLGKADNSQGTDPNAKTSSQEGQFSTPAPIITPWDESAATRKYETLCESPKSRDERDLCQQWRMAEAAAKQLKWLKRQFLATCAEIIALVLTLAATAWAAWAAGKAARAAQDSVRWMVLAERPRLAVERLIPVGFSNARNAPADDQPLFVSIRIAVKNVGRSTGILKSADFDHGGNMSPEPPPMDAIAEWAGMMDIAEGELYEFPAQIYDFRMPFGDVEPVFNGQKPLWVFGCIRYMSIHGTSWRHGFAFQYSPFDPNGSEEGAFFQGDPGSYWYDIEEKPEEKGWPNRLWHALSHRARSTFRL